MVQFQEVITGWHVMKTYLSPPESEKDLDRLIRLSDYLIDMIGDNEEHELMGLLDTVGTLIAEFEKNTIAEPEGDPIDRLKFLLKEHGLKQKDLTEVGSPGVVSEVLNRKRELNKRQIIALGKRFNCSPATFL